MESFKVSDLDVHLSMEHANAENIHYVQKSTSNVQYIGYRKHLEYVAYKIHTLEKIFTT